MKRKKLHIVILLLSIIYTSCKKDDVTSSNDENNNEVLGTDPISIPDSTFKTFLISDTLINTNKDEEISIDEAEAYTGAINAQGRGIKSVVGIEYFTNIVKISLFNNEISSIDVSKNTKVKQLLLESNEIESIDISTLSVLTDFKAHSNNITYANIANGNNENMWRMELQGNKDLTCIIVDELPIPDERWIKDSGATYNTTCD